MLAPHETALVEQERLTGPKPLDAVIRRAGAVEHLEVEVLGDRLGGQSSCDGGVREQRVQRGSEDEAARAGPGDIPWERCQAIDGQKQAMRSTTAIRYRPLRKRSTPVS
jgi:hypothetical protein